MGDSLTFAFDVDGVICQTEGTDYGNAMPKSENIARINALYDQGYQVIIFTGRGTLSGIDWRAVTEKQFKDWGLKYHTLIFGKPSFDIFVDDHAWNVKDFEEGRVL